MTITLTPDIENALAEQARKQGMTPEGLVLEAVREKLAATSEKIGGTEASKAGGDIKPRDEWEALLLSVGSPAGVSLSNEAASSDNFYD
jgi:hypothetical protein